MPSSSPCGHDEGEWYTYRNADKIPIQIMKKNYNEQYVHSIFIGSQYRISNLWLHIPPLKLNDEVFLLL